MRKEYDFSKAKRASEVPHLVALRAQAEHVVIEQEVLAAFKATGNGWQNRLNNALKEWLNSHPNFEHA